jgi:Sec-independent protein translocase protein TatA
MFNLDPGKLLVIAVVAIILLGPDRLPQVARQIGAAWRSFNEFRHRMESEVRSSMPDLPPTSEIARLARSPSALLNHLSNMSEDDTQEPSAADAGGEVGAVTGDGTAVDAAGAYAAGAYGAGADEVGVDVTRADTAGADAAGVDGAGAAEVGVAGASADTAGADAAGADGAGAVTAGADAAGADGAGAVTGNGARSPGGVNGSAGSASDVTVSSAPVTPPATPSWPQAPASPAPETTVPVDPSLN